MRNLPDLEIGDGTKSAQLLFLDDPVLIPIDKVHYDPRGDRKKGEDNDQKPIILLKWRPECHNNCHPIMYVVVLRLHRARHNIGVFIS